MPLALNPFAPHGSNVTGFGRATSTQRRTQLPSSRRARRSAHPGRAVRGFGAVSLVIALVGSLLVGSFGAMGSASAQATTNPGKTSTIRTDTSENAQDPAAPTLVVAPQEPALAVGADEYVFEVLVRNPLTEEVPGGTLSLRLTTDRFESAEALTEFEAGATADAGEAAQVPFTTQLVELEVDTTAAEGEQAFTVSIANADLPLGAISAPGVYGVEAELRLDAPVFITDSLVTDSTGGTDATKAQEEDSGPDAATDSNSGEPAAAAALTSLMATTTAIWRGQSFGQRLPLTIVVPMVLPDSVRSMPTRADLSDAAPRLDELLTSAEQWEATLAIDPRIIAGIRAYGDATPEPARELLTRLEQTSLPTFLLQFADADPAAQAALGFDELLQPLGLSYLTRHGSFEAPTPDDDSPLDSLFDSGADSSADSSTDSGVDSGADTTEGPDLNNAPADPEPDTQPGADDVPVDPQAPSIAELLDWPQAQLGAWPANGDVDAKTLALLKKSGIERLILDSGNVSGAGTARAQVGGFDTLIASAGLNDSAAIAIGGETETERAGGLAELAAQLAFGAQPTAQPDDIEPGAGTLADQSVDPVPMVLALDRGAIADAESPAQLLESLAGFDWVRPLPADELSGSTGGLQPGEVSVERTELLSDALKQSDEIDDLSPLLEQPGYLIQYQRTRLLNIFATRYAEPGASTVAMHQATQDRDEKLLAGVQIVPSENTQLVGTTSNVPVLVRNSLPFDAAITLRASPISAAVAVPERRFPEVSVAAESNTTVLAPVRTRVSSGSSGLLVQVADSRDDAIYDASVLHLTIRSSYETILLITLGGLAVVLLGLGVWRSILRRKNQQPTAGPQASQPAEPNTQE